MLSRFKIGDRVIQKPIDILPKNTKDLSGVIHTINENKKSNYISIEVKYIINNQTLYRNFLEGEIEFLYERRRLKLNNLLDENN